MIDDSVYRDLDL